MSVEEKVIDIVSNQLDTPSDDIAKESSFVDDLKADSLDIVELVMALEDEFDILHVLTPGPTHYELSLQGLRANRHVFVEKPFTTSTVEADHLVEEAEKHGVDATAHMAIAHDPPTEVDDAILGQVGQFGDCIVDALPIGQRLG